MNLLLRISTACLGIAGFHGAALASIRVQPMSYDLGASGSETKQDVRVENTGDQPMPVDIIVQRREILPDGTERRTAADADFLIFPPQAIVPANSFQTFRVQYIGDPLLAQTKLFLITVSQLPVDTSETAANGMQFLFNVGTLAAVSPRDAVADVRVVSVRPAEKTGLIEVTVKNDGNRYARLRNGTWTVRGGDGTEVVLDDRTIRSAIQQGLIEPGTERIITLPVEPSFRRDGASVTFKPREIGAE